MKRYRPSFDLERDVRKRAGNSEILICGIDEVGVGALAGPVMAAAVVLAGDELWVRETHAIYQTINMVKPGDGSGRAFSEVSDGRVAYRADGFDTIADLRDHVRLMSDASFEGVEVKGNKWQPSIHMPRWASRTQLVVKDIRAERLQKITEADAISEGTPKILWASEMRDDKHSWRGDVYFDVRTKNGHSRHGLECSCHKCPSEYCGCNDGYQLKLQPAQCAFRSLWDDIYTKKPELQWHADPWVWRTEFERKGI